MKRSDLVADLRRFVGGGGFITRQGLAEYLGYSDPHAVDSLLHGLERVKGKLPCFGSGATARAARETGRNFYGFEINKEYYRRAKEEMIVLPEDNQITFDVMDERIARYSK